MTGELQVPTWGVAAAVVVVVLLAAALTAVMLTARRARARSEEAIAASASSGDDLRAQLDRLDRLEQQLAPTPSGRARHEVDERREYVITRIGDHAPDRPRADGSDAAPMLPAPAFADLVLRESTIRIASVAAGVRRAMSPEVLARVRVEMRREVRRARKQRRADVREARRLVEERRRADASVGAR